MMTPYNNARGVERIVGDAASLAQRVCAERGRWLIWGPQGAGKTTLTSALANSLESADMHCWGIAADPGSPGFGVPGALALGRWVHGLWRVERLEPLCTLDAVRYRLPLMLALRRLVVQAGGLPLLVDAPGAVRGPAAAELLAAILEATDTGRIIAVVPESGSESDAVLATLGTLNARVLIASPSPLAHRRNKRQRARDRTGQWDRWLGAGEEATLDLAQIPVADRSGRSTIDWQGRQLALLDQRGEPCALGEGIAHEGGRLRVRMRRIDGGTGTRDFSSLLVRDAKRGPEGLLGTVKEAAPVLRSAALPPDSSSPHRRRAKSA